MSLSDRTREAVDGQVARLHDEYDMFRVFGDTVTLSAERYRRLADRITNATPVGVGCWLQRSDGRLLLVRDRDGPAVWEVPGGVVAATETPESAVRRLVDERTGVDPVVGDLLLVRRRRVRSTDGDGPLHTLWAVFEGETRDGGVVARGDDATEARWWDEHPGPVDERIQGRVRAWAAGHVPVTGGSD